MMISKRRPLSLLGALAASALCAGVLAAVPAVASASPHLEKEGSGVEYSGTVVAVSSNIETETSLGTWSCKRWVLTSSVSGPKLVKGSGTAEICSASGLEAKYSGIVWSGELVAGGTGHLSLRFHYSEPALGLMCTLETPSGSPASTTWTDGSNAINIGAATLEGSGLFCATSGTLHGSLELFTSVGGTKVLVRS